MRAHPRIGLGLASSRGTSRNRPGGISSVWPSNQVGVQLLDRKACDRGSDGWYARQSTSSARTRCGSSSGRKSSAPRLSMRPNLHECVASSRHASAPPALCGTRSGCDRQRLACQEARERMCWCLQAAAPPQRAWPEPPPRAPLTACSWHCHSSPQWSARRRVPARCRKVPPKASRPSLRCSGASGTWSTSRERARLRAGGGLQPEGEASSMPPLRTRRTRRGTSRTRAHAVVRSATGTAQTRRSRLLQACGRAAAQAPVGGPRAVAACGLASHASARRAHGQGRRHRTEHREQRCATRIACASRA